MRTLRVAVAAVGWTLWYGTRILFHSAFKTSRWREVCRTAPRRWSRRLVEASSVTVEFEGLEHLREGGQILVANHESWYDVLALAGYLPVEYRFVAKKELGRVPVFGPAWQACGHISIDRQDRASAIESLEVAARQIRERDTTIVMFPEGTRSESGELQPFKKGAFVLAIQAGVPIVPVGISGSRDVMAKHRWRIRPGTIRIRIGEPIPVDGLVHADRDRLTARAHSRVAALGSLRGQGPGAGDLPDSGGAGEAEARGISGGESRKV